MDRAIDRRYEHSEFATSVMTYFRQRHDGGTSRSTELSSDPVYSYHTQRQGKEQLDVQSRRFHEETSF